ncbi:MAG: hypothetical protein HYY67_04600 [Thaumarchaeota archaeon]|nr:hypothetical protein [Nitrososphaerota archaeon]
MPFIDEHSVIVLAPPTRVWENLVGVIVSFFSVSSDVIARAMDASPRHLRGSFPLEGSSIVGFRVSISRPPEELVLEGRHRFSTYLLRFLMDNLPNGSSSLRAQSYAVFPGLSGSVYRMLVIGTRAHILAVKYLLKTVKKHTEN